MLCACGCGTPLASKDAKGRPRRFVHGHNGRRPVEERFWEKVDKTGECWVWTGAKTDQGYGSFWTGTDVDLAHRVAWRLAGNPDVPELDHVKAKGCTSRLCVRLDHLEPVTHAENMERTKTGSCRQGHSFTAETTYIRKDNGRRTCLVCQAARRRLRTVQEALARA